MPGLNAFEMRRHVFITFPSWAFVSSTCYLYSFSPGVTGKPQCGIAEIKPSVCQWLSKISCNMAVKLEGVSITPAGCCLLLVPEINIHFHIFILLPYLFNPGPGGVKIKFLSDGLVVRWWRWTSLPLLWCSSTLKSGCPSLVVFSLEGVLVQWHLSRLLEFNL